MSAKMPAAKAWPSPVARRECRQFAVTGPSRRREDDVEPGEGRRGASYASMSRSSVSIDGSRSSTEGSVGSLTGRRCVPGSGGAATRRSPGRCQARNRVVEREKVSRCRPPSLRKKILCPHWGGPVDEERSRNTRPPTALVSRRSPRPRETGGARPGLACGAAAGRGDSSVSGKGGMEPVALNIAPAAAYPRCGPRRRLSKTERAAPTRPVKLDQGEKDAGRGLPPHRPVKEVTRLLANLQSRE